MNQTSRSILGFFLLTSLFWGSYSPPGKTEQAAALVTKKGAPLFDNLGNYHHPINTQIPLAQRYFDQGLILFYGFDSGESIRSFREAIRLDPTCAMCHWGLALALGSKNNMPLDGHEKQDALSALKKAKTIVDPHNDSENAYIDALLSQYSSSALSEQKQKNSDASKTVVHCGASLATTEEAQAYANAMQKVVARFPKDVDAKNLYVFSLFNVAKWNFWSRDGKPQPQALEITKTLESALAMEPKNPAANHYYIHVMEQSPTPEKALPSANLLRDAVPGAEHLVHMPSHIYLLTGRYHEASLANQKAIEAFKQYEQDCRAQGFEPEINYLLLHNLHFLWYAALMEGQSALSLKTADVLMSQIPMGQLKSDTHLQMFLPVKYFSQARFGKWHDILMEARPIAESQFAIGMWHYARGVAYTYLSKPEEAQNELVLLQKMQQQKSGKNDFNKFGEDDLQIAEELLTAMIAGERRNFDISIVHWNKAIQLDDNLGYKEPPAWYFPLREGLGNELLKSGKPAEAEAVFRQDLKQYPNNGWALFGLEKSLRAQGKNNEADKTDLLFREAWKYADVALPVKD